MKYLKIFNVILCSNLFCKMKCVLSIQINESFATIDLPSGAFAMFRQYVRSDFESPVKQCLANDRADGTIIASRIGVQNFVANLRTKPPLWSRTLAPS